MARAQLGVPVRDAFIALSFANFCFLKVWSSYLDAGDAAAYFSRLPPSPPRLAALFVNDLLLASILFLAAFVIRRWNKGVLGPAGRIAFVVLLVIPLNSLRLWLGGKGWVGSLNQVFRPNHPAGLVRLALLAAFLLALLLLFSKPIARAAAALLLVLSPFALLTFARGAVEMVKYDPAPFRDQAPAARLPVHAVRGRVVWVIFDEMDQRLAFLDRAPTVELHEFDRFRAHALYAENAYPPASDTAESIPSLVIGSIVETTAPRGPGDLELFLKSPRRRVRWSTQPTVFSRARARGANTAVVGWYHPYCRQFGDALTDCWWTEYTMTTGSTGSGFWPSLVNQARSIAETSTSSPWGPTVSTEMGVWNYEQILERARRLVSDPGLDLIFVHLPVPHPPFIYDRTTRAFTLRASPIRGYWDALALADRTLGELRAAMERAGTWSNTSVLLSADHPFREALRLDGKSDMRVPFLLRLPGEEAGAVFQPRFNTVITPDLLLELLDRAFPDMPSLEAWLARRAAQP